ncbi:hypothetical protein SAMN05661091_2437 [Paenibacillus uliginis N3/975]|uniref:Uncharacterized protein n=1 Tax=Paenibacillus uliginis N3/975 TaxID=1313296 RepID=A0A1X7HC19_9BACL|nr:hypothetical protein SAMN05661091_2437 [Paenibacillus uliginis N3/975]
MTNKKAGKKSKGGLATELRYSVYYIEGVSPFFD